MILRACVVCGRLSDRGRCERHRPVRASASSRGYGFRWRRLRAEFLAQYGACEDCGAPATVPDHDPVSRAELVRRGDPDPDAFHHLVPRCAACHGRRTVRDDGAFGNPRRMENQ